MWKKEKKKSKELFNQKHHAASYFTKFASVFDDVEGDERYELPNVDNFPQTETCVGENVAETFLDYVQKVAEETYKKYIKKPKELIMNSDDIVKYESATECHICKKKLNPTYLHCHRKNEKDCDLCRKNKNVTVRDHCHITGKFRGAAHNTCNLNYRINPKQWKLPIVFHNLRGTMVTCLSKLLKMPWTHLGDSM